ATRSAKWALGLAQAGTWVEIGNIGRAELPRWIGQRLARQEQQLDSATLEWMADKVEGNLLAAFQEVQKLGLLYPAGAISATDVERAVLNVARYDVFGLRDAMLAGQPAKALTVLAGLRAEGEALPLVLWAVGEEVRVLARLAAAQSGGQDLQAEMRRQRVFGPREHLLRQTLNRVPPQTWPAAVQHAHDIDRLIKGLKVPGRLNDPWEELGRLALRIAITRSPSAR
ncbi:MAG: DNA polymerase III subunit delta, partial [Pollutimonas bauzanensis]